MAIDPKLAYIHDNILRPWMKVSPEIEKKLEDDMLDFHKTCNLIHHGDFMGYSRIDVRPEEVKNFQKIVSQPKWTCFLNDSIIQENKSNSSYININTNSNSNSSNSSNRDADGTNNETTFFPDSMTPICSDVKNNSRYKNGKEMKCPKSLGSTQKYRRPMSQQNNEENLKSASFLPRYVRGSENKDVVTEVVKRNSRVAVPTNQTYRYARSPFILVFSL